MKRKTTNNMDKILGSNKIKELGFSNNAAIELLTGGGSIRNFYRIKEKNRSVILLISNPQDKEFENYVEVAAFLKKIEIGVPEIYYYNIKKQFLIAEDIGDLNLQLAVKKKIASTVSIYKQAIDTLLRMQVLGTTKISQSKLIMNRKFDYDTFRWETQYFTEYFLGKYCAMKNIEKNRILQSEFHKLAMKLVGEPLYFMHRDFQAQNIFLKQNKVRIIDFQGARQGLLTYDIVSLLKDPYVVLKSEDRKELIEYYIKSLKTIWKIELNPKKFIQTFTYTGLQRNMQALGAFSFLTLVRKKAQFAQYIPAGLHYLKSALSSTKELPKLAQIINSFGPKVYQSQVID